MSFLFDEEEVNVDATCRQILLGLIPDSIVEEIAAYQGNLCDAGVEEEIIVLDEEEDGTIVLHVAA